jgi:hypothetical protein
VRIEQRQPARTGHEAVVVRAEDRFDVEHRRPRL